MDNQKHGNPEFASNFWESILFLPVLQTSENVSDNLLSSGLSTQIRAEQLAVLQVTVNSSRGGSESSNGVGDVLALDIGSATVARLTNGKTLTDVGTWDKAQATDKGSSAIGENVTVQVGGDNNIVILGLTEELVDHGVDDLLLNGNGGELGISKGPLGGGTEETISLGQDVGLVGDSDERRLVDAGGTSISDLLLLGNALDGLGNLALGSIVGLLLLDIEILGVLADNNHVNGLSSGHDSLDRRAHGSKKRTITLILEDLDSLVREGSTGLLKGLETGLEVDKVELEAERRGQGFEDAASSRNDFLADTVTRDETCKWEEQLAT
ncbi:hypothetical protein HG531_013872 [Fusarium graminearum]|nr:hypothetical protein HG531_013872 [Fusarium graminearum]